MLKERKDAKPTPTWTTIDADDSSPQLQSGSHRARGQMAYSNTRNASTPYTAGDGRFITPALHYINGHTLLDVVDGQIEDADVDIDPDIREHFVSVQGVLSEPRKPRSAFDMRNETIMPRTVAPARLKVIVGGKVQKTLESKGDERLAHMDESGNYIGTNLGPVKKRLLEDLVAGNKRRRQEMVRATQEKRSFKAMAGSEEEWFPGQRRAVSGGTFNVTAADGLDSPTGIYTRLATEEEVLAGHAPERSMEHISMKEGLSGVTSPRMPVRNALSLASTTSAGQRTSTPIGPTEEPPVSDSEPDDRQETLLASDLEDIQIDVKPERNEAFAYQYDIMEAACEARPRVVAVVLHEAVNFSPGSVLSRIFGGVVQEVLLYPENRLALVVFAFPDEAESFVAHVQALQRYDRSAYERLQIKVTWYKNSATEAIHSMQQWIYVKIIQEEARRVLSVRGIPLRLRREDFAREMGQHLSVSLVKVSISQDSRRYVRTRDGNTGILEFFSIKDAFAAKMEFEAGMVAGYVRNQVAWGQDPCDKAGSKFWGCSCHHCKV